MRRRELLPLLGAGLTAGFAGWNGGRKVAVRSFPNPSVAVIKAASYSIDLTAKIVDGLKACKLDPSGKTVLLKPALVDLDPNGCINTHASVVAEAYRAFQQLGAASITIGDGPEYHRDTWELIEAAGYRQQIPDCDSRFVDLNGDDVVAVADFAGVDQMYLSATALGADIVVSLAKLKTHHRTGVSLSMQNLFGVVPGSIYGWPKHELNQIGLSDAALELTRHLAFTSPTRKVFAIVDGIVGMEGRGPILGDAKQAGVLIMGSDLPSVDATCCRIMGIDPAKLEYLSVAADRVGVIDEQKIEQRGEKLKDVRAVFKLLPQNEQYRMTPA
ncbi:MAG: DUF362 domain-containing protein [Acidobacteriota bacterium]